MPGSSRTRLYWYPACPRELIDSLAHAIARTLIHAQHRPHDGRVKLCRRCTLAESPPDSCRRAIGFSYSCRQRTAWEIPLGTEANAWLQSRAPVPVYYPRELVNSVAHVVARRLLIVRCSTDPTMAS